jgi:hypothetical protein
MLADAERQGIFMTQGVRLSFIDEVDFNRIEGESTDALRGHGKQQLVSSRSDRELGLKLEPIDRLELGPP